MAQHSDTLMQLAFDTSYIKAQSIHKIEADLKDEKRMTFTSSFEFTREGKLAAYRKIVGGNTVYSRRYSYDKKGRLKRIVIKRPGSVEKHKFTYSKDNKMYESALVTQKRKVGRLLSGNYTFKKFDCYADLDSLNRIKRSLTYHYKRGEEDHYAETSTMYTYKPGVYEHKELTINTQTGNKTVHFHTYQTEHNEDGLIICAEYQHNRDPKDVIEYKYEDQWIMIYENGRDFKYWKLPY